jgi:uncharacterized membrane protein
MTELRNAVRLVAICVVVSGCTGDPPVRASAPDAPTVRVRGLSRLVGDSVDLTACGSATPTHRLLPSDAMAAARAQLQASDSALLFLDVEAAATPDSTWDVAVVHRARVSLPSDTTLCTAPLGEVDALGAGPNWSAHFAKDSLFVVRGTTPGRADSTRIAVSRAPAIDGTVLYRSMPGTARVSITLTVSPIQQARGLREGTAQVNARVDGCLLGTTEWRNATARLTMGDSSWAGCASYAEPLRDPTKTRRRF